MKCASRQLLRTLRGTVLGPRPWRAGVAALVTHRRGQCDAMRAHSKLSLYGQDSVSFEVEGELAELQRESTRLLPAEPHGVSPLQAHPAPATVVAEGGCQSPGVPPVAAPRWAQSNSRRRAFTDGNPEYARDTIAFLHGVLRRPFGQLVAQLGSCHADALLVVLEYVARCRNEETALVPTKLAWSAVERACWAALVVADARQGDMLTSKHLAHAAQWVSHTLSTSTGPAALPFLLLVYRHRESLRRRQAVVALETLLCVAPPDTFTFTDPYVRLVAKEAYTSALSHLLWRTITMNDKDFDKMACREPHKSGRLSQRPSVFVGGHNVVQIVEQVLLWRSADIHASVRRAALLWVQKHSPRQPRRPHRVEGPVTTFAAVVRDPLLGPRPVDEMTRDAARASAAAAFDALRRDVTATACFTSSSVEDFLAAQAHGPAPFTSLIQEMATMPRFCPSHAPPAGKATAVRDGEGAAVAEMRVVLRILSESSGTARRDLLATAQARLLHVSTPKLLVELLESCALAGYAVVLQAPLVQQALRTLAYQADEDVDEVARERLLTAVSPILERGGALDVLRASMHALPHWLSLTQKGRDATSPQALRTALVARLAHMAPRSLIPVVLDRLVQDREQAAFRLPEPVVALVTALVSRVRVTAVPSEGGVSPTGHTRVMTALHQLAQQEAGQAPLHSSIELLDVTGQGRATTLIALDRTVNEAVHASPTPPTYLSGDGDNAGDSPTLGQLLAASRVAPLSEAEQRARTEGWQRLSRLARLDQSLAEEVQAWQRVSQGHFHYSAHSYAAVCRAEDSSVTDAALAEVFARQWTHRQAYSSPTTSYVRDLLHRVSGRQLVRHGARVIAIITGEESREEAVRLALVNDSVASLERTVAASSQPLVAVALTHSLLRACGRRPVFSRADSAGKGATWTLVACPALSATAAANGTDVDDLVTALRSCPGDKVSGVTCLLEIAPAVRECFAAMKGALSARLPVLSRRQTTVLWTAAQGQLWYTLVTLHLAAAHLEWPLSTSHAVALVLLYRDAITTVLYLATHEATDRAVTLRQSLPDGLTLADIFTPALHARVFTAACLHLAAEEAVELCTIAVTATTATPTLTLGAVPLPAVQTVVRQCITGGVSVPSTVRAYLSRSPDDTQGQ